MHVDDLRVFNTQTKQKEHFVPLDPHNVRLFVCGPTVYGPTHAGHAKTYTQFDFIATVLKQFYPHVSYVMNETDIDDKLIVKARHEFGSGTLTSKVAQRWSEYFWDMMDALGNHQVDNVHKATDHVPEVISQVQRLLDAGHAYTIPENGVYFDLSTFTGQNKLTHAPKDESFTRLSNVVDKRNPNDFAVWKFAKDDEPAWEASFGRGRPGWHIEDTAITEKYLGQQYDIHGGATDLISPHHEAEIAQMESLSHKNLVKYWMHTGLLEINGRKMGKSLDNFVTVEKLLEDWNWRTLRYTFLRAHYRSSMNLSVSALQDAVQAQKRVEKYYHEQAVPTPETTEVYERFLKAILNDFNTPEALGVLFSAMTSLRASQGDLDAINGLLGGVFDFVITEQPSISIQESLSEREQARKNKDWVKADALRRMIENTGWHIEDHPDGPKLVKK